LKKIQRFVFLVPSTLLFCETRGFHFFTDNLRFMLSAIGGV
jgi:hypothetical protein